MKRPINIFKDPITIGQHSGLPFVESFFLFCLSAQSKDSASMNIPASFGNFQPTRTIDHAHLSQEKAPSAI